MGGGREREAGSEKRIGIEWRMCMRLKRKTGGGQEGSDEKENDSEKKRRTGRCPGISSTVCPAR